MGLVEILRDGVSSLMGPSIFAIIIATIIALSLPLLLHLYIYRSASKASLPTFLLLGLSGAGKSAFVTHVERGTPATTRTSQVPLTVEASLPASTATASSRFRSVNDPSLQAHKKFLLVDTPGHGKLRYQALEHITKQHNLKGIIFMVDAANLTSSGGDDVGGGSLGEAAEYLHDVLLLLQRRTTSTTSSRAPSQLPVLMAANKQDLFTALPAALVRKSLEDEITRVRESRSKGLLDSGVADYGDEKDFLGDGGSGKFAFSQLEEFNVPVDVAGGVVQGNDGVEIDRWWDWMGGRL
ncbi:MAG: hypothetical protein M1825_002076 [Sarcosagium campestre]|nr:MAG: hypothetical protein M1825_002076 [Sarcosagium campestre]